MKHFKLFLASFALMGAMNANAQTDVTATYLTNADFTEGTPLTVNVHTYAKDIVGTNIAQMQSVDGWDIVANGDARAAGVFTYGDGLFVGGDSYFTPSTNPDGVAEGNALGMVAVWSASLQYTQDVTFPAGVYTLTFPVYNSKGGTSSISTNLFGFLEDGGTKHYATNKTFPVNSWSTMSVTFTLDEQTSGKISLGYVATNSGSGSMPHLFLDKVTITYTSLVDGVKQLWEEAHAAAQEAFENPEYSNIFGEENDALYAEICKEEPTTLEGYEEATAALQEATATFIAAKDAYDAWANASSEEYPVLNYADPAKRTALEEACDPMPVSAADAQEKTAAIYQALRAYYESHALAEGVDGAVDFTSAVESANAATNSGWTHGIGTNQGQGYTDANGDVASKYLDGGWASNAGANIDMTREVTVPAGKYLLTVTARGSVDLSEYTLSIADNSLNLPHIGASGGVFNNGWNDASIEFESNGTPLTLEIIAKSTASQQWISINRFRLVQLEEIEVPMADDADYAALYEVASYYQDLELGFDLDEYAPYNNVEAVLLRQEIESLDPEKAANYEYTKEYIQGLTEAVQALVVVPNEEELNAVYDGDFALQEAHESGDNVVLPGWTTVSGNTRLILKDTEAYPAVADADAGAALFVHPGVYEYGHTSGYTMPLNGGELYELTFKYCAWQNGSNNNFTATIKNAAGETVASESFGKVQGGLNTAGSLKAVKMYFTPAEDGDFILSLNANGNSAFTDVKIMKTVKTDLVLLNTDTEVPEEQYAGTVTTDRVLLEGLNTLILPFETTKEEIGATTVLEYTGTTVEEDGLTLNFTEVESLSANVPYAVMMDADAAAPLSFEMKEVTPAEDLTVADDNFTFVGTYVDIPKGNDIVVAGDYVAGAEKFKKAKGGNRVAAYRAYLKKAEEAPEAKIAFNFNGTIVDGIEAVEILNKLSGNIYNLNGQKMEKAQKGVNIINGKKVLVK